jgi:hypothetical protein
MVALPPFFIIGAEAIILLPIIAFFLAGIIFLEVGFFIIVLKV